MLLRNLKVKSASAKQMNHRCKKNCTCGCKIIFLYHHDTSLFEIDSVNNIHIGHSTFRKIQHVRLKVAREEAIE